MTPKHNIFSRVQNLFKPATLAENILLEQIKKTPALITKFLFYNFKEVYKKAENKKEFNKLLMIQGVETVTTSSIPKLSGLTLGSLANLPLFGVFLSLNTIILLLQKWAQNEAMALKVPLSERLRDNIKIRLTQQVLQQTQSYREAITPNKISAYIDKASMFASYTYDTLPKVIVQGLISTACVLTAFATNPLVGFLTIVGVGGYGYHIITRRRFFRKADRIITKGFVDVDTNYRDVTTNARPIQENNHIDNIIAQTQRKNDKNIRRFHKIINRVMPLNNYPAIIEVLTCSAVSALANILTGGDITSFGTIVAASTMLMNSSQSLIQSYKSITRFTSEIQTALNQLSCKKEYQIQTGDKVLSSCHLCIKLNDVHFAYPDQKPVLTNINLDIHPGEFTVLIGTSGAGKSTLLKLIRHNMEAQKGNVTINDINLKEIDQAQLNDRICFVYSDPTFLKASLRDNLRLFKKDASDEEIKEVLHMCALDNLSLDRQLDASGTSLSSGQKQRVALAQAFLKRAPITLLDEPTSALDSETKSIVLESLKKFASDPDRTVVMIAHNLEEISSADRGIVIELKNNKEQENPVTEAKDPINSSKHLLEIAEGVIEDGPIHQLQYYQNLIQEKALQSSNTSNSVLKTTSFFNPEYMEKVKKRLREKKNEYQLQQIEGKKENEKKATSQDKNPTRKRLKIIGVQMTLRD